MKKAKTQSTSDKLGLGVEFWCKPSLPKWSEGKEVSNSRKLFVFAKSNAKLLRKELQSDLESWQVDQVLTDETTSHFSFSGRRGPVWAVVPSRYALEEKTEGHSGVLDQGEVGRIRNACGQWYRLNGKTQDAIQIRYVGNSVQLQHALYGFLLADYSSKSTLKGWRGPQSILRFDLDKSVKGFAKILEKSFTEACGHNLARHLTNLPPNLLNPQSFGEVAQKVLHGRKSVQVKVWEPEQLNKEGFHLLYHVGLGSEHGSRLIHIRYRPQGSKNRRPIAVVGKGVTFDTGGLDIKPSSNMRLMKKDMSGAGVVMGVAYACAVGNSQRPFDIYLAVTENAVSEKATRPGDVHSSREGLRVEIHNTDAEGRLAMADALSYAAEQKGKDEPEYILDTATLTGAMRVSVGVDLAGYFSNDEKLARKIEKAAKEVGEPVWRMPLVPKYLKMISSSIADLSNASESGFGGAITAALFLQKFVKQKPWAHFDVMAWNSSSDGAISEGGNGQTFLVLRQLLSQ